MAPITLDRRKLSLARLIILILVPAKSRTNRGNEGGRNSRTEQEEKEKGRVRCRSGKGVMTL